MAIESLAISGLLTLDMHSLNNEGSEGNYLLTRQVNIVDKQGNIEAVNAISGDMWKHIQAEHLYQLAKAEQLPLCQSCNSFNPNRITGDDEWAASFTGNASDSDILTSVIKRCILDDAEGILITNKIADKKRSIARKSAVEFGWVIGRPAETQTDSYFHVKFAPEGRGKGTGSSENQGQNIFYRPASSGNYAVVLNTDIFRIGRNDITLERILDANDRKRRISAVLKSILFTFIKPTGALRNTQNPHVLNFDGCITLSRTTYPAPVVSALNPDFRTEINSIASVFNSLQPNAVEVMPFSTLSEFAKAMHSIIDEVENSGD